MLLLELGHQLADPLAGAVGLLPLLSQSKLLTSGSQLSFPDMERLDQSVQDCHAVRETSAQL